MFQMPPFSSGLLIDRLDSNDAPVGRRGWRGAFKGMPDPLNNFREILKDLVLPHPHDTPTEALQLQRLPPVAIDVDPQLRRPMIASGPWADIVQGAAVPEASVDEDRQPSPGEHDIRPAHRGRSENAKSQTGRPERRAQPPLRTGVPPSNAGHLLRAGKRTARRHADLGSRLLGEADYPGPVAVTVKRVCKLGEQLISETQANPPFQQLALRK